MNTRAIISLEVLVASAVVVVSSNASEQEQLAKQVIGLAGLVTLDLVEKQKLADNHPV